MMQRLRCWMLQPWLLKNTTAEGCGDPKTLGSWETNWAPGASPFSDGDIAPTKSINMWYLRQYFEDQFPTRWRSNRHHDIENYVSWILSCFFLWGVFLISVYFYSSSRRSQEMKAACGLGYGPDASVIGLGHRELRDDSMRPLMRLNVLRRRGFQ